MRKAMDNPGHWAWRKPAPTVSGTVGHVGGKQAGGHLNLTAEEGARLQTFRGRYPFCGNQGQVALQIGNAVPPKLAAAVASAATGVPARQTEEVAARRPPPQGALTSPNASTPGTATAPSPATWPYPPAPSPAPAPSSAYPKPTAAPNPPPPSKT